MQFTCVFDSPSRVSSRRNFISGNIACTVSASISPRISVRRGWDFFLDLLVRCAPPPERPFPAFRPAPASRPCPAVLPLPPAPGSPSTSIKKLPTTALFPFPGSSGEAPRYSSSCCARPVPRLFPPARLCSGSRFRASSLIRRSRSILDSSFLFSLISPVFSRADFCRTSPCRSGLS